MAVLVEKLLDGVLLLGRASYGKWQLRRLLSGVIVLAWLVIMAAIWASAMLIGGFYAGYRALLHYGMDPQNGIFIALLLFAVTTVLFVFLTLMRLHQLSGKLWQQSPVTARVSEAVDAFLEGFNE